jgi:hypothetical protein
MNAAPEVKTVVMRGGTRIGAGRRPKRIARAGDFLAPRARVGHRLTCRIPATLRLCCGCFRVVRRDEFAAYRPTHYPTCRELMWCGACRWNGVAQRECERQEAESARLRSLWRQLDAAEWSPAAVAALPPTDRATLRQARAEMEEDAAWDAWERKCLAQEASWRSEARTGASA